MSSENGIGARIGSFLKSLLTSTDAAPSAPCEEHRSIAHARSIPRRDFYVYFHKDSGGNIFYVGKGTGDRAWSKDRHETWNRYVADRLGGVYTVEIHENGLTEAQAIDLEAELIAEYGGDLVNWINPGRQFDYKALERYHSLRHENRAFVIETRALESTAPEAAIQRYRTAFENLLVYANITTERGLIAELTSDQRFGEITILDRLTLCLVRQGRLEEARAEAERYFDEFPKDRGTSRGKNIQNRLRDRSLKNGSDAAQQGQESRKKSKRRSGSIPNEPVELPYRDDIKVPRGTVERNVQGRELERQGLLENAIEFYQINVQRGADMTLPYERLAIIYRKRKNLSAELAVLLHFPGFDSR